MTDIRPFVGRYLADGFDVCPLDPGTKAIYTKGWNDPKTRFELKHFRPDHNVGVRLGLLGTAPYNRALLDCDLDAPEAALIADRFLPPTGAIFGRTGKPNSHRLYTCDDPVLYEAFKDPKGEMVLEVRGHTEDRMLTQTVLPGSTWTDKHDATHTELVEWAPGCDVALAAHLQEQAAVRAGMRNIYMSVLLARAFPGKGGRHDGRLPLAGYLLRQPQLLDDEVENIGLAVMDLVNGSHSDWLDVLNTTRKKKRTGKKFTAGTALSKVSDDCAAAVASIREKLVPNVNTGEESPTPQSLARAFRAQRYVSEDRPTLYFQQGTFYRFKGSTFDEYETQLLRQELYDCFKDADKKQIDEIMDALKAITALDRNQSAPCWLIAGGTDPAEVLACRTGLLHVPTKRLIPPTPSFYAFNQVDIDYDPNAPTPTLFLDTLGQYFPNDEEAIQLVQEVFGYALTPDRRLQKIVMFIGPKRSGKGTIAKVLKHLVGKRNVCNPTLATIGETFGRQGLIGKTLATIGDLRLGPRSDLSRIAEVLLGISGQDEQTVHRKNKEDWNGLLPVLFLILSNEIPDFKDASGALASRFVLLELTQSFYGKEDQTLADRIIATDLPGILNWALEGRERLYAQGYFTQPKSGEASLRQLDELASPVRAFLRECCRFKVGAEVKTDDVYQAWCRWCVRNGHQRPGTTQTFGKDLRAAAPTLRQIHPARKPGATERPRFWTGLELLTKSMTVGGPMLADLDI